jgi:hypothetical protein
MLHELYYIDSPQTKHTGRTADTRATELTEQPTRLQRDRRIWPLPTLGRTERACRAIELDAVTIRQPLAYIPSRSQPNTPSRVRQVRTR